MHPNLEPLEVRALLSVTADEVEDIVAVAISSDVKFTHETMPGLLAQQAWPAWVDSGVLDGARMIVSHPEATGGGITVVTLPLPAGVEVSMAEADLSTMESLAWAAPVMSSSGDIVALTPNDPLYGQQWHHDVIETPAAWDQTQGDPSVIVAVLDSGVDLDHEDLVANIWSNPGEVPNNGIDDDANGYIDDLHGWDFRSNDNNPNPQLTGSVRSHGTHVSGIVAADTNNAAGVAGVAGDATIMPLRVLSQDIFQVIRANEMAAALVYAVDNGARIANISLRLDSMYNDPVFLAGLNYAYDQGMLIVVAAGNDNLEFPPPRFLHQVVHVAATDQNDVRASFSNYGDWIDISAPGVGIWSTIADNAYDDSDGTSMAAPNVAGVAALVWSRNPAWTREQVLAQLLATADEIDSVNDPSYQGKLGAGRVNAYRALTDVFVEVRDAAVFEGNSPNTALLRFPVVLDSPSLVEVSVQVETILGGSAVLGSDYLAASGAVVFAPGVTEQFFEVTVVGDDAAELHETLNVRIFNPVVARLSSMTTATGTIADDDHLLSIEGVEVVEGDAGTTIATVPLALAIAPVLPVSVNFAVAGLTATPAPGVLGRFADFIAPGGVLVFGPGETNKTIEIEVLGDTRAELDELLRVFLTQPIGALLAGGSADVRIINDDGPAPTLAASDVVVREGDQGTRTATFTFALDVVYDEDVIVQYSTRSINATVGEDYLAASGTLQIPAGQSSAQATVTVLGDAQSEPDEQFAVEFASTNVLVGAPARGVIFDDDERDLPILSIPAFGAISESSPSTSLSMSVTLSQPSELPVSVSYRIVDKTTTYLQDYIGTTSGTLVIAPGVQSQQFSLDLSALDDLDGEPVEEFFIDVFDPINAILGSSPHYVVNSSVNYVRVRRGVASNDEPELSHMFIEDVTVVEGNGGPSASSATVFIEWFSGNFFQIGPGGQWYDWVTQPGTASTQDYVHNSDFTRFDDSNSDIAGAFIHGDLVPEGDETFSIRITLNDNNPRPSTVFRETTGVIKILDDDHIVIAPIPTVTVDEGSLVTHLPQLTFLIPEDDPLRFALGPSDSLRARVDSVDGRFDWVPDDSSPTPFNFSIRLLDDATALARTTTSFSIVVNNLAPTAIVSGQTAGLASTPLLFTLEAFDPSPVDQAADFSFDIDWDGDGTIDETVVGPSGIQVQHAFATAGTIDVKVIAIDKDGGASQATSLPVHVFSTTNSDGNLIWDFTDGDDVVQFVQTGPNAIEARTLKVGGVATNIVQTFSGLTGRVVAYGYGGNDVLDASGLSDVAVTMEGGRNDDTLVGGGGGDILRGDFVNAAGDGAEGNDSVVGGAGDDLLEGDGLEGGSDTLRGGTGNDTLLGDAADSGDGLEGRSDELFGDDGDDLLFGFRGSDSMSGGDGNDVLLGGLEGEEVDDLLIGGNGDDILSGGTGADGLLGGAGRDLIIGGLGMDSLIGGLGEDMLVADATDFDLDVAALLAIHSEWISANTYEDRIAYLTGTSGGSNQATYLLVGTTVFDDGSVDDLLGGFGDLDWYLFNILEDMLNDQEPNETATDTAGSLPS